MDITRRTDYAIRLIAALIENKGAPLSVREVAEKQDIPYAFARSIQHDLALGGFIRSLRGARGGMILAKDPDSFTLLEFIETLQGAVSIAVCTTEPGWCPRDEDCTFHNVWLNANTMLRDYLSSATIKDILEGKYSLPSVVAISQDADASE
ncbi:MAG: Rrf2 family transcriptional regulator [Coriobacteriia bacterium]|nr:Rrf2 family transcriptional regulator [Coriobacteriia bacterium]